MACYFCEKLSRLHELTEEELVWQFPHSVALLGPWQYYTGYCLLIARRHATEIFQLPDGERQGYLDEMSLLAHAIEQVARPRKINYELLGNQVPHLHWHLFSRQENDPEHLKPVWLAIDRAERDPAEKERLQAGTRPRRELAEELRSEISRMEIGKW
ncbi:MAG: HIT family protein [Planctomycetes bacterium]|nr:HIT family protein [Planctomycetota bacterium]